MLISSPFCHAGIWLLESMFQLGWLAALYFAAHATLIRAHASGIFCEVRQAGISTVCLVVPGAFKRC